MINVVSVIKDDQIKIDVTINGPAEIVIDEFVSIFKTIYGQSETDAIDAMCEIKKFLQEVLEDDSIKS